MTCKNSIMEPDEDSDVLRDTCDESTTFRNTACRAVNALPEVGTVESSSESSDSMSSDT